MGYNAEKSIERNARFMSDSSLTGVLIRAAEFGPVELPKATPLEQFDFPREIDRFCDETIERFLRFRDAHAGIDDDWIPCLKPYLGIAEHSCFMGGSVSYGGGTSYHHPGLDDITKWNTLSLNRLEPHYNMMLEGMAYLRSKSERYGFYSALRGGDGPMDIANAVRGNDILYDFYDEPEACKDFMEFCAEATAWTFENQRPLASKVMGGYISGISTFMPGNCIGHVSEDASCLTSPAMYEEFGLPYTMKLMEKYDYGMLHIHSLGRACIPLFTRIDKFGTLQLSTDPKEPETLEVYKEYADVMRGRTVMLDMTPQEVYDNAEFLTGKRTIINLCANSVDEANRAVEFARGIK